MSKREVGQRAYEAWRGPKVDVFGTWESLLPSEKRSWAAAEEACAVPAQPAGEVTQLHRAQAVELVSKLGCWGRDMTGQPNTLGHIDLDLVAAALAAAEQTAFVAGRASVKVRPLVLWFAEQMEAALQRNDHKGGWHGDSPLRLMERLVQESAELEAALSGLVLPARAKPGRVRAEAADVANMAMMVADHFREGGPSKDQGREGVAGRASGGAPSHYESNGQSGDGQVVCDVCGGEADEPHTHQQCHDEGELTGARDEHIDLSSKLAAALGLDYTGESYEELLAAITGENGLIASKDAGWALANGTLASVATTCAATPIMALRC
jgi:hypothetical protein